MESNKVYSTRARTQSGAAPPPPPLFSPDARRLGSLDSGNLGVEAIANAMKPSYASAVAGLAGASRAGDSSEYPSLSSEVQYGDFGLGPASFGHENEGDWTPVTPRLLLRWSRT
ncbi:hypothetical protein DFH09DRAFT_1104405 [Mycena vulgaris]|nr:hypothetical protein DFH09DRAFT_1104405 [Mycena vulgaris]